MKKLFVGGLIAAALCISGCPVGTITGLDNPPPDQPVPPAPVEPMYHEAGFYKEVNADGSGGTEVNISCQTGTTEIDKALKWLASNAAANTGYTLSLSGNITGQTTVLLNDTVFNRKEGVTLFITTPDENEKTVTVQDSCLFWLVGTNAKTLVLDGAVALEGQDNNAMALVQVDSPSTVLKLKGKAEIRNNKNSPKDSNKDVFGGGVRVRGGAFMMSGGAIHNNTTTGVYGGGVYVDCGVFTMSGGAIYINTTDHDGGGVYVDCGAFMMSGGAIYGNKATGNQGGANNGGGVYVTESSTFTMNGGAIYGNEVTGTSSGIGGGVYVTGDSTFTMNQGKIEGDPGDGEYAANKASTKDDGGAALYCETASSTAQYGNGVPIPLTNDATDATLTGHM